MIPNGNGIKMLVNINRSFIPFLDSVCFRALLRYGNYKFMPHYHECLCFIYIYLDDHSDKQLIILVSAAMRFGSRCTIPSSSRNSSEGNKLGIHFFFSLQEIFLINCCVY